MSEVLRVLVVADNPLARAGLVALLAREPGCTVVGQVAGDDSLPSNVDLYRPDVLVWDVGWDAAALERLADLSDAKRLPVVVLLADEARAAEALVSAGEAGRGLLPREVSGKRLAAAVRTVAEGLVALDPRLIDLTLHPAGPVPSASVEELTPRELEVLQLLAEGLPNKVIARRLEISEHTVKFHVNALLSKLGAQSRTDAVVRAARRGLIIL